MQYFISQNHTYNNCLDICMKIPAHYIDKEHGLKLFMPRYIPGSYMLRDFSKHIIQISAKQNNVCIPIIKLSTDSWLIKHNGINNTNNYNATLDKQNIYIQYTLYCYDKSVRGNYCDQDRILINGAASFLYAKQYRQNNIQVYLQMPGNTEYKIYTSLNKLTPNNINIENIDITDKLIYIGEALNYDELIDNPIIIDLHQTSLELDIKFNQHKIILMGDIPHNLDKNKLAKDVAKICLSQNRFFDDKNLHQQYLFIIQIAPNTYGGLEHKNNTLLQCSPEHLPLKNKQTNTNKYIEFLGLCSHEYFHNWWVKRIKPEAFINADLQQEIDTSLLWIFEGFTSYYDDLFLYKAGLINQKQYIKLLEKNLNNLYRFNAHYIQSINDSSIDAWNKYYKPDENSHNVNISYYTKGSIIALCIDLHLRIHSQNKFSLDTVVKYLWQQAKEKYLTNINLDNISDVEYGITYSSFLNAIYASTQLDISQYLHTWVYNNSSITELPFMEYLQQCGINCNKKICYLEDWGIQYSSKDNFIYIDKIIYGGIANLAKLNVGDILLGVNNIMVSPPNPNEIFSQIDKNHILITYIRNRQIRQIMLKYQAMKKEQISLSVVKTPTNKYLVS